MENYAINVQVLCIELLIRWEEQFVLLFFVSKKSHICLKFCFNEQKDCSLKLNRCIIEPKITSKNIKNISNIKIIHRRRLLKKCIPIKHVNISFKTTVVFHLYVTPFFFLEKMLLKKILSFPTKMKKQPLSIKRWVSQTKRYHQENRYSWLLFTFGD